MRTTITVDDTQADPEIDAICAQIRADTGLMGQLVYQLEIDGPQIRAHCYEKPRHFEGEGDDRRIPTYIRSVATPAWLLALDAA